MSFLFLFIFYTFFSHFAYFFLELVNLFVEELLLLVRFNVRQVGILFIQLNLGFQLLHLHIRSCLVVLKLSSELQKLHFPLLLAFPAHHQLSALCQAFLELFDLRLEAFDYLFILIRRADHLLFCFIHNELCPLCELKSIDRFFFVLLFRRCCTNQTRFAIPSKRLFQNHRQFAFSERNKFIFICQGADTSGQSRQRQINFFSFFKRLPFSPSLRNLFRAS